MTAVPNRHSHNLPSWTSSFIGRERELAEVKHLVISTRLLTLTGAGGCGKTRLAGATANRLAASPLFEHGSWFIDLARLSDPLAIPQTIAQVLSVPEAHDRHIINSVADFLQHKRCLLILDNCEHLLPACADLAQTLLDADPHLHILATSREPLNVSHETVWLVPSLAVPEAYSPSSLTHLAESEAIQLFVARAHAALPGFALDESNVAAVVQICRRLDGIPWRSSWPPRALSCSTSGRSPIGWTTACNC
jgi:non-specific serine/threonine protein kinase